MLSVSKNKQASTWTQNKIQFIHGGKVYFDRLIELINQATESIHLQTYIFADDETGKMVSKALQKAAARKISVHLLADGYASQSLPKEFINELKTAGVQFRFYEPLFKSRHFYFGRRLHHKVLVVDTKYAIVGGINIANHYNDMPKQPAWLDFAVLLEGEIAKELCILCWKTWNNYPLKMSLTPCEEAKIQFTFPQTETVLTRMRRNDWVRRKNEISGSYIEMIRHAKSHLTILCSYFLPSQFIRRLLRKASERGVEIKVITTGSSDIILTKHAERWLYDWLLRNHIELYEYQSNILHAKVAVCDGEWMTIGSYNVNNISAYASIELNVDIQNSDFTKKVEHILEILLQTECKSITMENHIRSKNIFIQLLRWISYQFIRSVFFLITFYYKREK
jgi:cardiolipin synthase A/B